ncbi:MAG: branched-chain amino acid ABC transporter substrate-binding protein, partial [Actinobacteria bacterium]|nr:branched-chain amino acid ABC transporter substrate-binding protein [Actinomycetota bacterium]
MGHRRRVLALAILLSVVAVACSGGDSGPKGVGTAEGKPLVVGMINMEDTPIGSFPELRRDAEAA